MRHNGAEQPCLRKLSQVVVMATQEQVDAEIVDGDGTMSLMEWLSEAEDAIRAGMPVPMD